MTGTPRQPNPDAGDLVTIARRAHALAELLRAGGKRGEAAVARNIGDALLDLMRRDRLGRAA